MHQDVCYQVHGYDLWFCTNGKQKKGRNECVVMFQSTKTEIRSVMQQRNRSGR